MRALRRFLAAVLGLLVLTLGGFLAATWAPDKSVDALAPRWAPPPSTFLTVWGPGQGSLRVHLRDEGPRDDSMPIVLLHGTSSSLHTWDGWTSRLRTTRRVIRFDLPAFGLTGPDPRGDYTIAHYVQFVRTVLDSLHVSRAVLVGNSLGGAIAWATALDDSARVARLVLVDAGGYPGRPTSVPIGFRIAKIPVLNQLLRYSLPRGVIESSVRNVYGNPELVTAALIDRYYDLTLRAGNREAVVVRLDQDMNETQVTRLHELRMPTLILWGERDHLISPENARAFQRDIAGSTVVMFRALGHVPHEEDPETSLQPVLTFLRDAKTDAPRLAGR